VEQLFWSVGAFIVALGLVVTFHEYGHFLIARKCGVQVQVFSVGFGRPLFSWKGKDGTQYQVAAIPLGGYVKMLDHEIDPVNDSNLHKSFRAKPVQQRMAIVVAGPIANFIFAVLALWLMLMIGMPAVKPVIGDVAPQSIAAEAGVTAGSEITRVDGRVVQNWQDVNLALVRRMGDSRTELELRDAQGTTSTVALDLTSWQFDPDNETTITSLGLNVFQPEIYSTIAWVADGSPADQAGLRTGDKIVGVDGTHTTDWEQIVSLISQSPDSDIELEVERAGDSGVVNVQTERVMVRTGNRDGQGFIGIAPETAPYPEEYQFRLQYGPVAAFTGGVERTWQLMGLTLGMVKKLITGDVAVKNLSGPIGIAQGAGSSASYGLVYFLSFLALISVSLGILNLLPVPMLDGGHLMFYIIEWVRGKPVSERVQEISFRVGLMILLTLMVVTLFNDIGRLTP